ncbi:type 1 fimbrial protein [Erwinia persicina]|nr:type 1 fimbrial protein [Erwinia persicina]MBD8214701.1 type 1 fimbrial protein [Erwinia persicina]
MCRKITACILLQAMSLAAASSVAASQPQGWGRVGMFGAIIETACAIDTLSRDQTIDMGLLPVSQIARNGQSVNHPFSIQLVNCILSKNDKNLPQWQHFQITFDGHRDDQAFSIAGDAQGIALQIADSSGNIATPGKPLPLAELTTNNMLLNYSLRLVSNNRLLRAGEYYSTVKFKMDYY